MPKNRQRSNPVNGTRSLADAEVIRTRVEQTEQSIGSVRTALSLASTSIDSLVDVLDPSNKDDDRIFNLLKVKLLELLAKKRRGMMGVKLQTGK